MSRSIGELAGEVTDAVARGAASAPWVARTGYARVDELLCGGLRPGQLVLVGGAPATGASMFALGLARHAALHELVPTVLVTSDAETEVVSRVLSAETSTPLSRLRAGKLEHEVYDFQDVQRLLDIAPLSVHAESGGEDDVLEVVSEWAAQPTGHHSPMGARVAVLDLTATDRRWSTELVRSLRGKAVQMRLAVVVVGRLHPLAMHGAQGAVPQSTTFVDIEEPANFDVVVTLTRPELTNPATPRRGDVDAEIVRHRYGSTGGRVRLALQGHYARLTEFTPDDKAQ